MSRRAVLLAVALWGCGGGPGRPDAGGSGDDGGSDGAVGCPAPADLDSVDLLFVVDTTEVLTTPVDSFPPSPALLPRLLLGDVADPERPVARTFSDVRIAVLTADVGSGGFDGWRCPDPVDGDDGVFVRTTSNPPPTVDECPAANPDAFVSWTAGEDLHDRVREVDCIVARPWEGCWFRQPFEALRRAVTGHGDRENAGFFREDALLAIVFLTQQDDCSPLDEAFFDPDDEALESPRCARFPERLQAVADAAELVLGLRPCPAQVFVGVYGGVSIDNDCALGLADEAVLGCLLDAPSMQVRFGPESPGLQISACGDTTFGPKPVRRILELQRAVVQAGGGAAVSTGCRTYGGGYELGRLARAIAEYGTRR